MMGHTATTGTATETTEAQRATARPPRRRRTGPRAWRNRRDWPVSWRPMAVAVIAVLVAARSLVLPLRRLTAGAKKIAPAVLPARGREFTERPDAGQNPDIRPVNVHSAGETGPVARAFDPGRPDFHAAAGCPRPPAVTPSPLPAPAGPAGSDGAAGPVCPDPSGPYPSDTVPPARTEAGPPFRVPRTLGGRHASRPAGVPLPRRSPE